MPGFPYRSTLTTHPWRNSTRKPSSHYHHHHQFKEENMKLRNQRKTPKENEELASKHIKQALEALAHVPAWLKLADPNDNLAAIQNTYTLYEQIQHSLRKALTAQ